MSHALIINDNRAISRGIQARLQEFGFESFDQVWSERQALEAAGRQMPDLIVVGETIVGGSPLQVADLVSGDAGVPVVAVTANGFMLAPATAARARSASRMRLESLPVALAAAA